MQIGSAADCSLCRLGNQFADCSLCKLRMLQFAVEHTTSLKYPPGAARGGTPPHCGCCCVGGGTPPQCQKPLRLLLRRGVPPLRIAISPLLRRRGYPPSRQSRPLLRPRVTSYSHKHPCGWYCGEGGTPARGKRPLLLRGGGPPLGVKPATAAAAGGGTLYVLVYRGGWGTYVKRCHRPSHGRPIPLRATMGSHGAFCDDGDPATSRPGSLQY